MPGLIILLRPILYGSHHPMSVASAKPNSPENLIDVVVGGPLCESGDIFTQEEGCFDPDPQVAPCGNWRPYLILEVAA